MENKTYIKLYRKIKEKAWYQKSQYVHLWVHILIRAEHTEKEFRWNGSTQLTKRGQFLTGRKKLNLETGIPETTIERILNVFEKEGQIGQQKNNQSRLITVLNYNDYQTADNKRTTNGQQTDNGWTHNKNTKNNKESKEPSETSSQVKEIMQIFYEINPTLNWGNKTYRNACDDLIKRYGVNGALQMAKQVVSAQGTQYAPRATNPYIMREKLADFKVYFDSEKNKRQNNKPKVAIIPNE